MEPPTLTWDARNGLEEATVTDGLVLASNGEIGRSYSEFPKAGTYKIRIRAYGTQAGNEPVKVAFGSTAGNLLEVDVPATADSPGTCKSSLSSTIRSIVSPLRS